MCRHTVPRLAALAALAAAGCTDRPAAPLPDGPVARAAAVSTAAGPLEELARSLARGLRAPALRTRLKAQLDASPYREHKLQFQRFLAADGGRTRQAIAREAGLTDAALAGQADAAIALELYLPVPAHRAAWRGDGRVLVATALRDHDVPVAFDTAGNRYLLSPETPPAIPVLALVPVETDFSPTPSTLICYYLDCGGGGDPPPPPPPPPSPPPGLYMTQAHFTQTFEGWLKGSPEFEVHMLGQKGQTDSLVDYQCAGERQPAPYYFDQNSLDWGGSVLLFSGTQVANYNTQHPGQNVRVFVVEDDDTACQIKTSNDAWQKAIEAADAANQMYTAGKDTTSSLGQKLWTFAKAFQKFLSAVASIIDTNDELVGTAVQDVITGEYHAGFNWIVKGEDNVTNGWIKLEMK